MYLWKSTCQIASVGESYNADLSSYDALSVEWGG